MKCKVMIDLIVFSVIIKCSLTKADKYHPTVLVGEEEAVISISIYHKNTYKWFEDSHRDNAVEYEVQIHLYDYSFGFILFNMPFKTERSGNIYELLRNGQLDIWARQGNEAESINNQSLTVKYSASIPYIIISIDDPKTIQLLFSERPKERGLTVYDFDSPYSRELINIEYK